MEIGSFVTVRHVTKRTDDFKVYPIRPLVSILGPCYYALSAPTGSLFSYCLLPGPRPYWAITASLSTPHPALGAPMSPPYPYQAFNVPSGPFWILLDPYYPPNQALGAPVGPSLPQPDPRGPCVVLNAPTRP